MKYSLVLLISLVLSASPRAYAQAQTGIIFRLPGTSFPGTSWKMQPGMAPVRITIAHKGTGTYPRLSANYDGVGKASGSYANQDSSTYRYTTNAHLGFDLTGSVPQATANGTILIGDYDTATSYSWNTTSSSYIPNFRIINLYDAQDRQVIQFFQTWASGTWSDFNRYSTYYNAAGNDTLSVSEDWNTTSSSWIPSSRYLMTFDAAGNVIKEIVQLWDAPTSAWKNNSLDSFTYDANHNETYQLQQNWSSFHNSWYNYAQASFIYSATFKEQDVKSQYYDTLASIWNNDYHAHYYYNTSDQVVSATTQTGSGATWVNSDSDSYTLLNSGGVALNTIGFTWSSGSWHPIYRITTTNGGAGLPFVAILEQWNGTAFVNATRTTTFYNSYDKPTLIYTEHWSGSAWIVNTSNEIKRYYYDLISTGVGNVLAGPGVQAYLYPVPATENINIAVRWSRPQQCTGVICDALGRQVAIWTDKPAEFYTREVSIASLPAGNYYIRLQGQTEYWSGAFVVTH